MKFKEWFDLQEVGTSTGDIAGFRRISIPLTRRMFPPLFATMVDEDPPGEKKKKRVVMQPQVQENVVTHIDAIAQQIAAGTAPPKTIKRYLNELIDVMGGRMGDSPAYLNMQATVQQDILPIVSRHPMYRREVDMLQALLSA